MSLELVHDASADIVEIGIYNPTLIPSIARTFANKVEAGEFGNVARAVVVLESDVGPIKFYWGEKLTHLEAVGLLHIASIAASQDAAADWLEE